MVKVEKKPSRKGMQKPSSCKEPIQCPHVHFRHDVPDRRGMARDKLINILATPKGYWWEDVKKEKGDGEKASAKKTPITPKRVHCKKYAKKYDKAYVHNFLAEVWSFLCPEMADRLKVMLMNEFSMSEKDANDFIFRQREANIVNSSTVSLYKKPRDIGDGKTVLDSIIKLRTPNKTYCDKFPKSNIGIRNAWIKDLSDLISEKMAGYVLDTMTADRTERQQEIAQTILNRFNATLEQKASLSKPKTQTHKTMVLVADRLSLWLDKNVPMSKENAERLQYLEEAEEEKKLGGDWKTRLEQKRKRQGKPDSRGEKRWEDKGGEVPIQPKAKPVTDGKRMPPSVTAGQAPTAGAGEPQTEVEKVEGQDVSSHQAGEPQSTTGEEGELDSGRGEEGEESEVEGGEDGRSQPPPDSPAGDKGEQDDQGGQQGQVSEGDGQLQPGEQGGEDGGQQQKDEQGAEGGVQLQPGGEEGAQSEEQGVQPAGPEPKSQEASTDDDGKEVGEVGGPPQPGGEGPQGGEDDGQKGGEDVTQPEPGEGAVSGEDGGGTVTEEGGKQGGEAEGQPQPAEGRKSGEDDSVLPPGAQPESATADGSSKDDRERGGDDVQQLETDESTKPVSQDAQPPSSMEDSTVDEGKVDITDDGQPATQAAADASVSEGPIGASEGGVESELEEDYQPPSSGTESQPTPGYTTEDEDELRPEQRGDIQPSETQPGDYDVDDVQKQEGADRLKLEEGSVTPAGPAQQEPAPGETDGSKPGVEMISAPGDTSRPQAGVDDSKPTLEEMRHRELIKSIASIIVETPIEETPRQEAIKDVLGKRLEKEVGDEAPTTTGQVASKVATWIDKMVEQVETEYGDRDRKSTDRMGFVPQAGGIGGGKPPPVSQKPKGSIFVVKKVDDRQGYDVDLISNNCAHEKIRLARGRPLPRAEVPNPDAALEPADVKNWVEWASAVSEMAQSWAEWIEDTVQEAQKRGEMLQTDDSPEKLKEWDAFRGKKAHGAQQWRKTKKEVDRSAELWNKKGMKSREMGKIAKS